MNNGPVDWYGEPAGGWPSKDDMQRSLRDPRLGISIRFIRQWKPPTQAYYSVQWRLFNESMLELARWQAALTSTDRAWLLELKISPA